MVIVNHLERWNSGFSQNLAKKHGTNYETLSNNIALPNAMVFADLPQVPHVV